MYCHSSRVFFPSKHWRPAWKGIDSHHSIIALFVTNAQNSAAQPRGSTRGHSILASTCSGHQMHFFLFYFFPLLFRVSGVLSYLFAGVPHKPNSQSQIKHWVLQKFVDTRFLKVVHTRVVAFLFEAISLRRACSDTLAEKAISPTCARPGVSVRKLVLLV